MKARFRPLASSGYRCIIYIYVSTPTTPTLYAHHLPAANPKIPTIVRPIAFCKASDDISRKSTPHVENRRTFPETYTTSSEKQVSNSPTMHKAANAAADNVTRGRVFA